MVVGVSTNPPGKDLSNISNTTCLLNSKSSREIVQALNPTVNFLVGDVNRVPLLPIESSDEIFSKLKVKVIA